MFMRKALQNISENFVPSVNISNPGNAIASQKREPEVRIVSKEKIA